MKKMIGFSLLLIPMIFFSGCSDEQSSIEIQTNSIMLIGDNIQNSKAINNYEFFKDAYKKDIIDELIQETMIDYRPIDYEFGTFMSTTEMENIEYRENEWEVVKWGNLNNEFSSFALSRTIDLNENSEEEIKAEIEYFYNIYESSISSINENFSDIKELEDRELSVYFNGKDYFSYIYIYLHKEEVHIHNFYISKNYGHTRGGNNWNFIRQLRDVLNNSSEYENIIELVVSDGVIISIRGDNIGISQEEKRHLGAFFGDPGPEVGSTEMDTHDYQNVD